MKPAEIFSSALQRAVAQQRPHAPPVEQLRTRNLRALLRHVVAHVPLYRDLYRERGASIEGVNVPDDLWRLPAVSKVDYIRVGPNGYTDERVERQGLYTQTTSGSVGASLSMFATNEEAAFHLAGLWAGWVGAGVHPQDRLLMMGAPYLAPKVDPFRSVFIPVQMGADEVIAQFLEFRPTVIVGLVESIALLAVGLRRRNLPERRDVRLLFPFGQTYSALLRGMVESGFDAPAFALYGSAETGWIGSECEQHDGFHVNESRVVAQIARTGKPDEPAAAGEQGEVIVTSLVRDTTPFIRYRLHDAAALDPTPCPCGRTSPRLTKLEGRVQDFLVATDQRWIGPSTVAIDLLVGQTGILDYRILQSAPHEVRVSLVLASGFTAADRERVEQVVHRHLGPVKIDIDIVDEIPRDPSGKRRRIFRTFDLP